MSGWLGGCVWLALLCVGCNGVGRAVVGDLNGRFAVPACDPALPCEPLPIAEPERVPENASPVELTQCEADAALCEGLAVPSRAKTDQCATSVMKRERAFGEAGELGALACTRLRLKHARESGEPAEASVALGVWRDAHLEAESDEPASLELRGGSLEHVSLALHGPITLRVLDSEQLRDLRVASDGAAQIELTRVRGVSVSIEGPQAALLLRRSSLGQLRVVARRIDLESSYVRDAIWRAEWLNATDATLLRVRGEVERSVLSACDGSLVRFSGCRSWTAVQGRFSDIELAACSEEISAYGSAMERAQLAGNLLLDGASLGSVILGLGELGAIAAWDTQLKNVTFCADQHSISMAGQSAARCARCDLAQEPVSLDACFVPGSEAHVESSESCGELAAAPPCGEPQPERMRPPRM